MDTLAEKEAIKKILVRLDKGELTYDEAKAEATPVIKKLNEKIKAKTDELNKKYGMKRKPAYQDFVNIRRSGGLL